MSDKDKETTHEYVFTTEDGERIVVPEGHPVEYQGKVYDPKELWELINGQ